MINHTRTRRAYYLLVFLFGLLASAVTVQAQQQINPISQINWPVTTGSGAPTQFCPSPALGSTTNGLPTITLTSATGVLPGQTVTGSGIPASTTVLSLSGLNATLSANATATASGVSLSFSSYGMPYTDVIGKVSYVCTAAGWLNNTNVPVSGLTGATSATTVTATLNSGTAFTSTGGARSVADFTFTAGADTGSPSANHYVFQSPTGDTTTGSLVRIASIGTSTALPLTVTANGAGVQMNTAGVLAATGGGNINASQLGGAAANTFPQKINNCGTTTTCANTGQTSGRIVWGTVALSGGTATVSSMTAFTSTTSFGCTGTDTTSAAAVKIAIASTSSITITGTGTDVVIYQCIGN